MAAAQDHLWTFGTGSVVGRLLHLRWPSINVVITPIDPKSRITENTVFRIGSITKTFTAIAVMQLRERGLVDLDAPANDYLRSFRLILVRPNVRPATVRHPS